MTQGGYFVLVPIDLYLWGNGGWTCELCPHLSWPCAFCISYLLAQSVSVLILWCKDYGNHKMVYGPFLSKITSPYPPNSDRFRWHHHISPELTSVAIGERDGGALQLPPAEEGLLHPDPIHFHACTHTPVHQPNETDRQRGGVGRAHGPVSLGLK
jgi:hypothetical protein